MQGTRYSQFQSNFVPTQEPAKRVLCVCFFRRISFFGKSAIDLLPNILLKSMKPSVNKSTLALDEQFLKKICWVAI
jgi:hypothetical protein